jgi:hypothetical protein
VYNEICVLDTNFLISKLGYLDTVLNLAEERPGSLLVLLPWVVIRELDGLKVVAIPFFIQLFMHTKRLPGMEV